jgi:outer membrane lipoprotein-sorting protein
MNTGACVDFSTWVRITSMKRWLLALLSLIILTGYAQELTAEDVLVKLEERSETMQDASFLITGKLIDADAQEFNLEIQVQMIPDENLVRMDFFQPDAVADNFMIIDKDGLYSYNFLTNQVTIFNVGDSTALGGILPASENRGGYQFTLNMTELFAGWNVSLDGYTDGMYNLHYTNKVTEGVTIGYVDVAVDESLWLPTEMRFYSLEKQLLSELAITNYAVDQNLDPEEVRYIDDTAEVIDER